MSLLLYIKYNKTTKEKRKIIIMIKSDLSFRSGKFNVHINVFNVIGSSPNRSLASEAE